MNFTCTVAINAPIDKTVALYTDPRYFKEWQDGFISYEPLSGIPGHVGAKSKITYVNGKHRIELIETIELMNLPSEMSGLYEHKHMINNLISRFTPISDGKTLLTTHVGYFRSIVTMPKLMALLIPGMFRKQNQKWLDQFKTFAEGFI